MRRWQAVVLRASVLGVGWWGLTRGAVDGVGFGFVTVAMALGVSLWVSPPRGPTWRPWGLLRFGWVFLAGSLQGGLEVARRALSPRMSLAPVFVTFRSRLPVDSGQDLFMSTLSLMPGTLGVERDGSLLHIHVLVDSGAALHRELESLEAVIAGALGVSLLEPE
jgi:multicomponent Na+:H+ antiporter subunit E